MFDDMPVFVDEPLRSELVGFLPDPRVVVGGVDVGDDEGAFGDHFPVDLHVL